MPTYYEQMSNYFPNVSKTSKKVNDSITVINDVPEMTGLEEQDLREFDPIIPKYLEQKTIKVERYYLKK